MYKGIKDVVLSSLNNQTTLSQLLQLSSKGLYLPLPFSSSSLPSHSYMSTNKMAEERNIVSDLCKIKSKKIANPAPPCLQVFLGASAAGLQAAQYFLKHTLPTLKAKRDATYHVYLINPSANWYFRVASPRVATSTKRLATEKVLFDIKDGFKKHSSEDFTFIEATATGLNTSARTVSYRTSKATTDESLRYHALVVATGSKTYFPAFSQSAATQDTLNAIKSTNGKVQTAKDIIIVGGGPTSVEFAGEVAEHRNGKPGWFSNAEHNVNITIITATDHLLPQVRPAIGKITEQKLKALNVNVLYNTRVTDASEDSHGRTIVTLAKGDKLEADLYVPAYGVEPNSSWLPAELLDDKKYLITNAATLRVDAAGPRVYSIGDVASYSPNNVWDILLSLPVLAVNMKRDLLSYNAKLPDEKPKGNDRLRVAETREGLVVPIGTGGGVGVVMGWKVPSWFVALLKGRDYLAGMSGLSTVGGGSVKSEVKWSAAEAAI
jgi:NADH dehydrogenase FAD-containing subunit